jgi:hypothetical protein
MKIQHIAGRFLVTMDVEVAATAASFAADVEPHARQLNGATTQEWQPDNSIRDQEFATVHSI